MQDGDPCPFLLEGGADYVEALGGYPFDDVYENRLDWIIRARKVPLDDLLRLPMSRVEAMLESIQANEDRVTRHFKRLGRG